MIPVGAVVGKDHDQNGAGRQERELVEGQAALPEPEDDRYECDAHEHAEGGRMIEEQLAEPER